MSDERKSAQFLEKERQRMVARQLAARGINDERVLEMMGRLPREKFVPAEYREEAYEDTPLPIGFGQTISQPYTVAFMAQELQLVGDEKVLEIGAGSGYQAAVLSRLARQVHTVERIPDLCARAEEVIASLRFDNVYVHLGDGTLGLPSEAPFDAIVVTASAAEVPPPYWEQTADGGCILMPVGSSRRGQRMVRYRLTNGKWEEEDLGGFAYVPLIGQYGWDEREN